MFDPLASRLLRQSLLSVCALLAACGGDSSAPEESAPPPTGESGASASANIDVWLERLEVGSRELYSARAEVVDALQIKKGERIADIGAGTGIYSLLFAEKTGPEGVVYAVDIAPRFLTLINQRAEDLGAGNIVAVLNRPDSATLPPQSIDIAFICDTYHYFDDPAAMLKSVYRALRPGGALYIVDYDLRDGETPPAEKRQVRVGEKGVIAEVESFGFTDAEEIAVPGLNENYMVKFTRP